MYALIGITLLGVGGVLYFLLLKDFHKIESEWSSYRCNPIYMPLAYAVSPGGFINVEENFTYCMGMLSQSVVTQMTDALGSQFSIIGEALSAITNPLSIFRVIISTMRKVVVSFATSTLGKASGPLSAFVYYLNKIQDLVRRMVGEGYIATFFGVTMVSFIEGFISLLISVLKGFITAMLIIAVILALFQPEILAMVLVLASALYSSGA